MCNNIYNLPGQLNSQFFFCVGWPGHGLSPFKGIGLSQTRLLRFTPFPHDTLHDDHELQDDQPPETVKEEKLV